MIRRCAALRGTLLGVALYLLPAFALAATGDPCAAPFNPDPEPSNAGYMSCLAESISPALSLVPGAGTTAFVRCVLERAGIISPSSGDDELDDPGGWLSNTILPMLRNMAVTLGDPVHCFVCSLEIALIDAMYAIGDTSFSVLALPTFLFMSALFAIWLTVRLTRSMLTAGEPVWGDVLSSSVLWVVALGLLGGLTLGGAQIFQLLINILVVPFLSVSVYTGLAVLEGFADQASVAECARLSLWDIIEASSSREAEVIAVATQAGFISFPNDAQILPGGTDPEANWILRDYKHGLIRIAYAVHQVGVAGLIRSILFLKDVLNANFSLGAGGLAKLAGFFLAGWMIFQFISFLITSGIRLLDPLLRIVFVVAVSPVLIACMVFRPTRRATEVGLRSLGYAAAYFLIVGIVFALALQLIMYPLGVDCLFAEFMHEHIDDPAFLERLRSGAVSCSSGSIAADGTLRFMDGIIIILMLMIAQGLIAQASTLAGQLAGAQGVGQLGEHVEAQTRGLATQMFTSAAYGVKFAAGGIGRLVGR